MRSKIKIPQIYTWMEFVHQGELITNTYRCDILENSQIETIRETNL